MRWALVRDNARLFRIVEFSLMPDRKDSDEVMEREISVQSNVTGSTERYYKFAYFTFDTAANKRMSGKRVNCASDSVDCLRGDARFVFRKKLERAFDICESVLRVDYPRHGLGFAAFGLRTSLAIQA